MDNQNPNQPRVPTPRPQTPVTPPTPPPTPQAVSSSEPPEMPIPVPAPAPAPEPTKPVIVPPTPPLQTPPPAPAEPQPAPAPVSDIQLPAAKMASFSPTPAPSTAATPPGPAAEEATATKADSLLSGGVSVLKVLLNWIVVPLVIVLILHNFVFQAFHVVGSSMEPILHEKDYLIISKIGGSLSEIKKLIPGSKNTEYIPSRGTIIVFRFPRDPSLVFVKRVVAIPGERVVVQNGKVTVFNAEHPQGFNPDTGHATTSEVTLGSVDQVVAPGTVFVLGDNRSPNGSYDSREWGNLPTKYIIGQAILRLIPINTFKVLALTYSPSF